MQQRVAIWIIGAFYTMPSLGNEAISGLIPIYLHLKKFYDRFLLKGFSLPLNHLIKSIINIEQPYNQAKHQLSINKLTSKQVLYFKSPLVDIDNRCNEFLSAFVPLDKEFSPGNCLYDNFPNWFSFYHLLWQPLDQCPIAILQVNLLGRYLVGNTSCVIYKRTRQGTTIVFYWLFT